MHHARSEGGKTRHCDAEPLAWSRSNADSAASGEVNPVGGLEVGVEGAGAPTRDVEDPFEWPPSM